MVSFPELKIYQTEVFARLPEQYRIESCGSDELSNVAYGGPDSRTLFIADAEGKILTTRLPVPGHKLYSHQ